MEKKGKVHLLCSETRRLLSKLKSCNTRAKKRQYDDSVGKSESPQAVIRGLSFFLSTGTSVAIPGFHSFTEYPEYREGGHGICRGGCAVKTNKNPRSTNGALRRKHRARMKAMGAECGICHGRLGPIHYDEPSDAQHPLSFVIDEIRPISRYREFGYPSPQTAANDWGNLQAAHYICNSRKSNKIPEDRKKRMKRVNLSDGQW